jgi:hypothetical protein
MTKPAKRVVVLNLVGLTRAHLNDRKLTPNLNQIGSRGNVSNLRPPFPLLLVRFKRRY